METKETEQLEKTKQTIQLVKGEFTPSEAAHVIVGLIDEKINFHKIEFCEKFGPFFFLIKFDCGDFLSGIFSGIFCRFFCVGIWW